MRTRASANEDDFRCLKLYIYVIQDPDSDKEKSY